MATIPFAKDGINYLLNDTTFTATVTGRENATITNIIIDETLEYNGGTYTVVSISNEAFMNNNITSLTMPDTIETIGYTAFYQCSSLSGNLGLPANLTSIGYNAFDGCSSLSGSLVLPANLTSIEVGAFLDCINLTGEMLIPKCVTASSQRVFENCTGFTSIRIEDGATVIPSQIAKGCTGLIGDLVIPDSVISIDTSAFNGCSGLNGTLTLGQNVQTIQGFSFYNCNFTGKVMIPHSVTLLEAYAFNNAHVEQDSFKELVNVDLDLDDLLGLPDTAPLEQRLEEEYEDTVHSSTDHSFIYKSANSDEIEINYAQSQDEGYDFMLVMDISDSMQGRVKTTVDSVEYDYPRMVYTAQILDKLCSKLLVSDYDNRVAITTFSSYNTTNQWNTNGFIDDYDDLQSLFWDNYVWEGNQTDYSIGLTSAINLINNRVDTSRKVVVFFLSDGRPNEGNRDPYGIYGGTEAQTLRNMDIPLYPISIFLSDAELADGKAALTAISYDRNTYYEARDVNSFQTIITEIIGDAIAEIEDAIIIDELSQYFELATGTAADLNAACGSAYIDEDGKIVWDLSGCSVGVIHTLNIKIKVIDDAILQSDNYPTNESLIIEDPYDTELPESPEVYISRGLESSKEVADANGDGKASPGEELTYTIEASNNGETAFSNLLIKDTLTGVLPYVEDTSLAIVDVNLSGTVTTKTIQDLINGFTVNLESGQTVTVTFKVTVIDTLDTQTVTSISNRATVGDTTPETDIPTKSDTKYIVEKMVKNEAGEDINKGTVHPGDILNYSIRATALSLDVPIGPITIIDEISEFVDHMGDEDTVTTMSGETFTVRSTFSANVMSVATEHYLNSVGDWIEVQFAVRAKDNTGGNTVYNQSIVTADGLSEETNMTEVEIFQLEGDPVKEISENSESGQNGNQVRIGDEITYNITYTNYTEEIAEVIVTDRLYFGLDFVSATNGGIYDENTRTVIWTIANVPGNSSGTISLVVRVNGNAVRAVGNYAIAQVGDNEPRFSNYVENLIRGSLCKSIKQVTKCRQTIKGSKIWRDDNNADNTRPPAVEISLIRDGDVYKSVILDSTGDGSYEFGCLPVWKNSLHKYIYLVDEFEVPNGYSKAIDGYNVINTLAP